MSQLPPGFQIVSPGKGSKARGKLPPGFRVVQGAAARPAAQQEPGPQQQMTFSPDLRSLPLVGPIAGAMGYDGRPTMETVQPGAQERFDAALQKVRETQYPEMSDQEWERFALGKGRSQEPNPLANLPLFGPITDFAVKMHGDRGAFSPYDATQLSQHGAMFGLTDEMGAGLGALRAGAGQLFGGKGPGMGEAYPALLELEQARRDLGREQQGLLGTGAELLGGIASGGGAVKGAQAIGQGSNAFLQTLKGTAGAGAQGAAYGFGATDGDLGDRTAGAGLGAAIGVAGGAAPGVVGAVGRGMGMGGGRATVRQAVRQAPPASAIRAKSKAAYKAMEGTGAVISQPAVSQLRTRIRQFATDEGIIYPSGRVSTAYPKVAEALAALDEFTAAPLGMKAAQTLHKQLRRIVKSTDPEEAGLGRKMLEQFEDWMDNVPAGAVSGNGKEAARQWQIAKTEWARFRRTQTIETALESAQLAKGGFAEGLRSQFRTILKSEKKRRGFSRDDLSAMRRFVDGGPMDAVMQWIASGRGIPGGIAGGLAGGPLGAAATMAAGAAARGSANRGARRVGEQVRAGVALPGGVPRLPPQLPSPMASRVGASMANPLLEDQRNALVPMFRGGR